MSVKKIKFIFIFLISAFILAPSVFASSDSEKKIEELNKKIEI